MDSRFYQLRCWSFHSILLGILLSPIYVEEIYSEEISFNRDIRPILSNHCYACHGPDAKRRQAELRLDVREVAIRSSAISPSKPHESQMIARMLEKDPERQMPPPDFDKQLDSAQKQLLEKWIASGAIYEEHWSFVPPKKRTVPGNVNAIDYFVQQRLDEVGLQSSVQADRRTLIRRLYSDLLGLPPTYDEVTSFVQDANTDAYEQLVQRILDQPQYGERMAMKWLDVVRFADTIGYHSDTPRNVWPYRDWVIRSFNQNKPFDRFTREQIAGDLLPDANQDSRIGSAYNRLLLTTEEGGAQPKDYEARMLTDRVRSIGTVWLGLTTGCAQCHDHKFDPLTTRDFYSLGAFFADIQETSVGVREPGMQVMTMEQQNEWEQLQQTVNQLKSEASTEPFDVADIKSSLAEAEQKRTSFLEQLPKCLVSVSTVHRRTVRILERGNFMDETGPVVQPGLPAFLTQAIDQQPELNRLDLANWLVSRENPLVARVVMNRLWEHFFGMGLSKIVDDLGVQGEYPPNLPLLDWLACEFIDSGWDYRHMVHLIVHSQTYQRSAVASAEGMALDPENREWSRQSRFRLDAELIRDQALATSRLLERRIGGPSVKPYQPTNYWENLNFPMRTYEESVGRDQYRRGLYTWWQRSFLHPSLLAFDAPSREECCAQRNRSNLPQQALVLLNDPSYVEAYRALAERVLVEAPESTRERLVWIWQQSLQRNPDTAELDTMHWLLDQQRSAYKKDPQAALKLLAIGQFPVSDSIDSQELAAWTHVARVLLNLHETITRN